MKLDTRKIVYFGTPEFAVPPLAAIVESGRDVPFVVTQPDRRAGRGNKTKAPQVKDYALAKGLEVLQPLKMKAPDFLDRLASQQDAVFVVAAFGRILPQVLLDLPAITLNIHASLLPRWRGASPIHHAILHGDKVTGVSIMRLVLELDAGAVMCQKSTEILPNETTTDLEARLSKMGSIAICESLDQLSNGSAVFTEQDTSLVTYASMIHTEDAKLDWHRNRHEIHNQVRAFESWPGTYTDDGNERIKILSTDLNVSSNLPEASEPGHLHLVEKNLYVRCKDGWIKILMAQRPGKKRQDIQSFLQGYRVPKSLLWK